MISITIIRYATFTLHLRFALEDIRRMQQSSYKIQITNPCQEDWNAMKTDSVGRFCDACAKSVIDFTGKSDSEISTFLAANKENKICGRFKKEQVHRIRIEIDQNILYSPVPFWQKFLVIILVAFGPEFLGVDFCFSQVLEDSIPVAQEQVDSLDIAVSDSISQPDSSSFKFLEIPQPQEIFTLGPCMITTIVSGSVTMVELQPPDPFIFLGMIQVNEDEDPVSDQPEAAKITNELKADKKEEKPTQKTALSAEANDNPQKPEQRQQSSKLVAVIEEERKRKPKITDETI